MARQEHLPATWAASSRPLDGANDQENGSVSMPAIGFQPHNPIPIHGDSPSDNNDRLLRRRRSSVAERLTSIGDVGGVNSFNNFARSWQRAAIFSEFTGGRQSFVSSHEEQKLPQDIERPSSDRLSRPRQSLIRAALENERQHVPETPIVDDTESHDELVPPPRTSVEQRLSERRSSPRQNSFLHFDPGFASPFVGSYGSITSRLDEAAVVSRRRVPEMVYPDGARTTADESQPLLVKHVEPDEQTKVAFVIGQSTVPQTVFNSVNTLIGVGMLSLPLALRYSGWIFGLAFFTFASLATSYTSKLLAKCLDVDTSLITFADLAYISFGTRARIAVSLLFCLELVASCVALVVLFADSMNALISFWHILEYKIVCGIIIVPLAFVPMRFLSFSSVLGIMCCFLIVTGILVDGMMKPHSPGSLRDPAPTFATPVDWRTLPLSFGLLMAPWGGHSVFPNIYRDMRHPMKYSKAINYTYTFTFSLEIVITVIGYLMFGDKVHDEITSNIFITPGYPRWLSYVIAIAVGIIPLTKVPLNARPIYSTCEFFLGLTKQSHVGLRQRRSALSQSVLAFAVRLAITTLFVVIAILVPSFDRIMALLGSLACSLVCVVLPCSFHLKIFGKQLTVKQKLVDSFLIAIFITGGVAGTVCACLPKRWLGAEK